MSSFLRNQKSHKNVIHIQLVKEEDGIVVPFTKNEQKDILKLLTNQVMTHIPSLETFDFNQEVLAVKEHDQLTKALKMRHLNRKKLLEKMENKFLNVVDTTEDGYRYMAEKECFEFLDVSRRSFADFVDFGIRQKAIKCTKKQEKDIICYLKPIVHFTKEGQDIAAKVHPALPVHYRLMTKARKETEFECVIEK